MAHPTSIAVASGAAVLLQDVPAGLVSAWAVQHVQPRTPRASAVPRPQRLDDHQRLDRRPALEALLNVFSSCRACSLQGVDATAVQPMLSSIAFAGNVTDADLTGATLHGNFDDWNMTRTNLSNVTFDNATLDGAVLDHTVVTRTGFPDGTDPARSAPGRTALPLTPQLRGREGRTVRGFMHDVQGHLARQREAYAPQAGSGLRDESAASREHRAARPARPPRAPRPCQRGM